uniref:Fibrillar collagen NC1 domain-containing protein n=1 Tax=Eptatretus burgeri TaxID=7764 RepID=A0A8C4N8L0_EPTBU
MDEVLGSLNSLKLEVERIRFPLGTQNNPARTCADLLLSRPTFPDGKYYIDPNQGSYKDAFKVFCNQTAGGEVCIYPDKRSRGAKLSAWSGETPGSWFSEFKTGNMLNYVDADGQPISSVQMTFMRLLSATARQRIMYRCHRSLAWGQRARSGKVLAPRGLRFLTSNDEEIGHNTGHDVTVIADGCAHHKGYDRTVLEFDTDNVDELPLVDIQFGDFGKPKQKFGFRVSPVCFHG